MQVQRLNLTHHAKSGVITEILGVSLLLFVFLTAAIMV